MDATNQNPEQVRSVKRKYVRKSVEGADAVESVPVVTTTEYTQVCEPVNTQHVAQAYADRVWEGQSPDLPLSERLSRVRAALVGQNLDCAGVVLAGNPL